MCYYRKKYWGGSISALQMGKWGKEWRTDMTKSLWLRRLLLSSKRSQHLSNNNWAWTGAAHLKVNIGWVTTLMAKGTQDNQLRWQWPRCHYLARWTEPQTQKKNWGRKVPVGLVQPPCSKQGQRIAQHLGQWRSGCHQGWRGHKVSMSRSSDWPPLPEKLLPNS